MTSTEVSALFGQNPRLTAYELYHLKKNPALDTFEGTERTEWGQALQHAIGERICSLNGVEAVDLDWQLATHSDYLAASGDFMITGLTQAPTASLLGEYCAMHGAGVLEIKNVDSLIFKNEWTETDMPDHIEIQLQTEMLCWDTTWGAVGVLSGGNKLSLYMRLFDPKVCMLIENRAELFMRNFRASIAPQPIMPQDAGMVISLHQYTEPNKVYDAKDDTDIIALCLNYKKLSDIATKATKERDAIKAAIFQQIGDAERAVNITGFNLSATMRPPVEIAAYTRAGFRGINITERKK